MSTTLVKKLLRGVKARYAAHLYRAGLARYQLGDTVGATKRLERAVATGVEVPGCHPLLARIRLPGAHFTEVLAMLHGELRPARYLEIGVADGRTLALSSPSTRAVGIDPNPTIKYDLHSNTTVHAMRSDDYFATHDVEAELGGKIDFAFIDGMHQFEFALRDFANVERHATPSSTIAIHDCYPFDRRTAERERQTGFWSGDIWRLVLALKRHRPDLKVHTIGAPPTGLGIVRNLDPSSHVLSDRMDEIVAESLNMSFSDVERDMPRLLNLYPNDPGKIRQLLVPAAAGV